MYWHIFQVYIQQRNFVNGVICFEDILVFDYAQRYSNLF